MFRLFEKVSQRVLKLERPFCEIPGETSIMRSLTIILSVALATILCLDLTSAQATTATVTRLKAYPDQVPDEQIPRNNLGDSPFGWGPHSWQGPESGKSNFHVWYDGSGGTTFWNLLFGDDAVTVSQLQSLSYWTKKETAIPESQDWWMTIYTAPEGDAGDSGTWYRSRLHGNYNHVSSGDWEFWTTDDDSLMFRDSRRGGGHMSLADIAGGNTAVSPGGWDYSNEIIRSITIQTDSGWDGFDGYVDGLTIALNDGSVGEVDLCAVPEASSIVIWSLLGGLGIAIAWFRRRRAA